MENKNTISILKDLIVNIFSSYQNYKQQGQKNINEFIVEEFKSHNIFTDEAKSLDTANEIVNTIDTIEEKYQDLVRNKKQGISREKWFENELTNIIKTHNIQNPDELIKGIKSGLASANNDIYKSIFGEQKDIGQPLNNTFFGDLNKKAVAQNLLKDIQNNTILSSATMDKDYEEIVDIGYEETKTAKDYFSSDFGSEEDKTVKKLVSSAFVIAKEQGHLPILDKLNTCQISGIVDLGLTGVKLAYRVASGATSVIDAVDCMIDRSVAVVSTVVSNTIEKIGANLGEVVGTAVGSVFGPIGTIVGRIGGKILGSIGGKIVGDLVSKGIEKIAPKVKELAKDIWKGVEKVGQSIWNGVKSLFSW